MPYFWQPCCSLLPALAQRRPCRASSPTLADGYANRRVIVFDADTGAYKRHWGAYGKKPENDAPRTRSFEEAGAGGHGVGEFFHIHSIATASKGNVYLGEVNNGRRALRWINKHR